jgi:hypothetical protein
MADAKRAFEDDEARHERRAVSTVVTLEGMVESTLKLAPSDGQVYLRAIRAAEDAEVRSLKGPDPRTPAQRRADALVQVCRQYLDAQGRPVVAGERPHVVVTIDVESLGGRSEDAPGIARSSGARLADVGAISAKDALMWACDAQVTRVITDAASRPLDVGRTMRITPPWIRKALLVRDGGCAFPHCGRPPSWCDPHHVVHWINGGQTGALQPCTSVSATSPADPPRAVLGGDRERTAEVPSGGRHCARGRGSRAAVTTGLRGARRS